MSDDDPGPTGREDSRPDDGPCQSPRIEDRFDWRNPDYSAVFQARLERLQRIRENPEQLPALRAYYRTHIADWINDWCMTYDPRAVSSGKPADVPFVLFPKQREWVEFTFQNWQDGEYGGTEKSRDVGLSWLAVAFSVALCTLYERIAVGLGSFKQEKVDWPGEMGSLFEKARYLTRNLPVEFRGGFDSDTCSTERKMIFPATGGTIVGEIGDNVGRGGRNSIYFVDETAYFERDMIVDMALSKNTPCRQDLSSVRGMKNSFAKRMHDGYSRKFTFHWRDNPLFTQEDYDKFRRQWGPVVTAQELDIDYQASVEGVIIPQEHVQAAIDAHVRLGITPSGVKRGALDVADEGRDLNAFAARHGILLTHCEAWSGKGSDLFATAERAINRCDDWLLDGFDYDADGLGAGIRGDAARIVARRNASRMRGIRIAAYRGSEKVFDPEAKAEGTDVKNVDRYQNAKAQSWASLAGRFYNTFRAVSGGDYDPDNIISLSSAIPDLSKICIQLSQPQWKISATGKLQVDKTPDGRASPNHADAVCILFRNGQKPFKISDAAIGLYAPEREEMMY